MRRSVAYEKAGKAGYALGAMLADGSSVGQECGSLAYGDLQFAADGAALLLLGPLQGWPNLAVIEPDGIVTTLVKNAADLHAQFDASGRYVLFTVSALGEAQQTLYLYDRKSPKSTQLKQGRAVSFRLLSNNRLLVTVTSSADSSPAYFMGRADGSNLEALSLPNGAYAGSVTGDGQHLLYTEGDYPSQQLILTALDGSAKRQVASSQEGWGLSGALSPDGQYVLVVRPAAGNKYSAEFSNLAQTVSTEVVAGSDELDVQFSPDSHWALVFSTLRDASSTSSQNNDKHTLYVVSTSDGKVVRAIAGATAAYFSPDGAKLAYGVKKAADATPELNILTLASGAVQAAGNGKFIGWYPVKP
jgi:hypothetical protein